MTESPKRDKRLMAIFTLMAGLGSVLIVENLPGQREAREATRADEVQTIYVVDGTPPGMQDTITLAAKGNVACNIFNAANEATCEKVKKVVRPNLRRRILEPFDRLLHYMMG